MIGDDLFGEIGKIKKFAKINRHQNKNIAVLKYSKVQNRQISSLSNCHIWKTAKYNSRQTFSFYSKHGEATDTKQQIQEFKLLILLYKLKKMFAQKHALSNFQNH